MEDTLRVARNNYKTSKASLNPCFNGRYSQSNVIKSVLKVEDASLNPCFNGRYSQRFKM